MTFLRLRKMPKTPSVNRIARDGEVMAEADGHFTDSAHPAPGPDDLAHLDRSRRRARVLRGDVLALDARLVAERQHDGADHGDQQDHAGELEVMDVVRVEHVAERFGVADVGRDRRGDRLGDARG